jgi:hypothetical protein
MGRFYSNCTDDFLLGLPKDRFWNKYKNMSIIRIREKLDHIGTLRIAESREGVSEIYRLNWQLEQLTGKETVDDMDDIKKRMKAARKAAKKGKKR